jgi:hypothetical protein
MVKNTDRVHGRLGDDFRGILYTSALIFRLSSSNELPIVLLLMMLHFKNEIRKDIRSQY